MTLLYTEGQSLPLTTLAFSVFRKSFTTFFSNRQLRGTAFVDMASYFAFGAVETFLPLYLFSLGIGAFQTDIIFAAQVVVIAGTKPFFGRIADRVDKRTQIVAGFAITGGAVVAISLAVSFAQFFLVSAVFGIGLSLSTVATSAYVADVAKKERIGASMGALSSIMDIGQSWGPLATGIVVTSVGYVAGFFASCALALIVCVIFILSVRDLPDDGQKRVDPTP
jgi:MFS family permease